MNDERIERLARELGDDEVAERLVAARDEVVTRVPDHVTRAHMSAILTEIRRTNDVAAAPATTFPRVPSLDGRRRSRIVDAAALTTRIAATAIGVAVLTTGGLAAANALPVGAQTAVADLAERVGLDRLGIDLPSPPAGPPDSVPSGPGHDARGGEGAPGLDRRDDAPGRHGRDNGPERGEPTPDRSGDAPGRNDDVPASDARDGAPRDEATGRADPPGPPDDPPGQFSGSGQPSSRAQGPAPAGPTPMPPPQEPSASDDTPAPSGDSPGPDRAAPGTRSEGASSGALGQRSDDAPGQPAAPGRPGADGNGTV